MAKLKFKGLEEYERQLLKLKDVSRECIGRAIYEGAKEIADEVKSEIENIPVDNRTFKSGQILNGISELQKAGLREGFGIAAMRNDGGYYNVKLGFSGYNAVKTKTFPNGQPNSMIARSVNSGTSFRQRYPFVDNAVNRKKDACEQKMVETFDKELKGKL